MSNEYKVITFSELKVGQKFENSRMFDIITTEPWVKLGDEVYGYTDRLGKEWRYDKAFKDPCLVRVADCEPVLDFDTWWDAEGLSKLLHNTSQDGVRELCRTAWENGAYKAT